jgi:hypothetical protein
MSNSIKKTRTALSLVKARGNRWNKLDDPPLDPAQPVLNFASAPEMPVPFSDQDSSAPYNNISPSLPHKRKSAPSSPTYGHSSVPSSPKNPARDYKRARKDKKNAAKREVRSRDTVEELRHDISLTYDAIDEHRQTICELQSTIFELQEQVTHLSSELETARQIIRSQDQIHVQIQFKLCAAQEKCQKHEKRIHELNNDVQKYRARERRAKLNHPVHRLALQEDGVIPMSVRVTILDLVSLGTSFSKVKRTILVCAKLMDVDVGGSFSPRSVQRVVVEGFVAAKLQIMFEIWRNPSFSLLNDGTEVKRITTNAKLICFPKTIVYSPTGVQIRNEPLLRTLPVTSLKDHSSQTQFDDWIAMWKDFFDTFARASGIPTTANDWRQFLSQLKGLTTDHANDQKCLYWLFHEWKKTMERESRGADILATMDKEEVLEQLALDRISRHALDKSWAEMTLDERAAHKAQSWRDLCISIGNEGFKKLSAHEQRQIDMFFETGCWNHKSINAFKHGTVGVSSMWVDLGIPGPVSLVNKTNTAALEGATDAQEQRILASSSSGGIPICGYSGMLFNHPDEKKGLQHLHAYYFDIMAAARRVFAKTTSNRYASHGEAATELLVHRRHYLEFMADFVRPSKHNASLNHMEQNFVKGMKCYKTLTELAAFALYSQVNFSCWSCSFECYIDVFCLRFSS